MKMTSSAAMTTTIVATVGSPANTPRRAIARANATVKRGQRDRRAPAERGTGRAGSERGAEGPHDGRAGGDGRAAVEFAPGADQRDQRAEQQRPHVVRAAKRAQQRRRAAGRGPGHDQQGGHRRGGHVDRHAIARRRHEDGRRERGGFHGATPMATSAAPRLPCPTWSAGACRSADEPYFAKS